MEKNQNAQSLAKRSFHALKWNYLGSGFNITCQFAIGVVLARLLSPADFGVVAISWLMIGFGKLIADFGLNAALVQKSEITDKDLRFVFTVQLFLGCILAVTGFYSAGLLSKFFNQLNAKPIIQVMSLVFLIQPFGQTAVAMMARDLAFKSNQIIRIISYLVGYVLVGIPLAYFSFGPWSLVGAQVVQSILFSILAFSINAVSLKLAIKPSKPGLFSFGSKVISTNLTNWSISNLDSFVVGHSLAVADLGLYNRAMALVASPAGAVTASLQSVLLSACSRVQNDTEKIKKAYLAATTGIGFVCLPIFLTVATVPDTIILGLYGQKWLAVIPILCPLALAVTVNALLAIVGPVLTAINKVEIELKTQVITLILMAPTLYITAHYSLIVLAWGVLIINIVRWYLLVKYLTKLLKMSWKELLNTILWPFIFALITALSTLGIDNITIYLSPWLRLILDIATASFVLITLARYFGRFILTGPYSEYFDKSEQIPPFIRNWLKN